MHNNFYFLRQLTPALYHKIKDTELAACFSQAKNELILGFARPGEDFYIKAALNPDFSCLSFHSEFMRTKKNSVDLFGEALGRKVAGVYQYENERSFSIHLEGDFNILFKLHGSRSNILLFRNNELLAIFKNKLVKDRLLQPQALDRPIELSLQAFLQAEADYKKLFPTFDAVIRNYLEEHGYFERNETEKWDFLIGLKSALENPEAYYIAEIDGKLQLSLLHTGRIAASFADPLEASTQYFFSFIKTHALKKEKEGALSKLTRAKSRTGNYILKSKGKLAEIERHARHEELANIIMANIYNIPPKATEAELFDFYRNQPILIKLKKELSPQKNAEILYRKAKNQKIEIKNIRNNLYAKQKELADLEKHINAIQQINDLKTLRSYIRDHNLQKDSSVDDERLPFRQFTYFDYEILVGKNAKNNDELTQKYAKKNDLWLHAKDATGSHVVVKFKAGRPFPKNVIEKAAQLAAYYSKRKNDTLCPVLYVQKKYVRKPKGSLPGQMTVDREEVILVEPALP